MSSSTDTHACGTAARDEPVSKWKSTVAVKRRCVFCYVSTATGRIAKKQPITLHYMNCHPCNLAVIWQIVIFIFPAKFLQYILVVNNQSADIKSGHVFFVQS